MERYKRLLREILHERSFRTVSPEEEARRAAERADLWETLLAHQRKALEAWIEEELERDGRS